MSKLCLGTVQFGTNYGIKNELGRQPTNEESFAVLNHAILSGIRAFDTASIYGNAEILLGKYGLANKNVKIISKFPPDCTPLKECVISACKESLSRLKAKVIDGYLLHDAADYCRHDLPGHLR